MGYTHYWRQIEPFSDTEWQALEDYARAIFDLTDVPLAAWDGSANSEPYIGPEGVQFNGVLPDECEDFYLTRKGEHPMPFCKTSRLPYDDVVVAVLEAAALLAPDKFTWSSDGDPEDHIAGKNLFLQACDKIRNELPLRKTS
jgi:hypothetical protein